MTAVRLQETERITVDGRLSEDAWGRATPATDFRQQDPKNGEPATESTDIRVVYDAIASASASPATTPNRTAAGEHMQRDE